jgi:hypothetical protein
MYTAVLDATPRRVAEIAACRLVSMFMLEEAVYPALYLILYIIIQPQHICRRLTTPGI